MILWIIKNGVPYDVAHSLYDWELLAYFVVFAQFENGNLEFDWEKFRFIER